MFECLNAYNTTKNDWKIPLTQFCKTMEVSTDLGDSIQFLEGRVRPTASQTHGDDSRGRSYIFVSAFLILAQVVLPVACILSSSTEAPISFMYVYVWQILMCVLSTSAFCILGYFVWTRNARDFLQTESNDSDATFVVPVVLFGMVSSGVVFYYSSISATCLNSANVSVFHTSKFVSQLLQGLAIVFETLIIAILRKVRCNNSKTRILIGITIAHNIAMLVNGVVDVYRADSTKTHSENELDNVTSVEEFYHRVPVFSICNKTAELINYQVLNVYDTIYPFPFIFCVFALSWLYLIWNTSIQLQPNDARTDERVDQPTERTRLLESSSNQQRSDILSIFWKLWFSIARYSWIVSALFVVIYFIFRVVCEVYGRSQNIKTRNETLNVLEESSFYIQTIYTYILIICAFLGYLLIPKEIKRLQRHEFWNKVLFLFAFGHVLLVLFKTIDAVFVVHAEKSKHLKETIPYLIKIIFHYVGIYCQTLFIIYAHGFISVFDTSLPIEETKKKRYILIKGFTIFLFCVNTEHFFSDSFLTSHTSQFIQDMKGADTYGANNWWILTRLLFPVVTGYRLISALMLIRIFCKSKPWESIYTIY